MLSFLFHRFIFAYGTNAPSDVKEMSVLDKAYQMGKIE